MYGFGCAIVLILNYTKGLRAIFIFEKKRNEDRGQKIELSCRCQMRMALVVAGPVQHSTRDSEEKEKWATELLYTGKERRNNVTAMRIKMLETCQRKA